MEEAYRKYKGIEKIEKKYEGTVCYVPPRVNEKCVRLNLNENLFGPSPKCKEILKDITLEDLCTYSLEENDELLDALSERLQVSKENIILHNGSSEMIRMLFEMFLDRNDEILLPMPGWSYYKGVADINHYAVSYYKVEEMGDTYDYSFFDLCSKIEIEQPALVVITTPNMPTGNSISSDNLEMLLDKYPKQLFVVDQAYWGFCEEQINVGELVQKYNNVVFVRTFSKFFGLANERIGFCICHKRIKDVVQLDQPLFRLSYTSRKLAIAAVRDQKYYDSLREQYIEEKEHFIAQMNELDDVIAFKSDANFVYIKVKNHDVRKIQKKLQKEGYLIRVFNFDDCYCLRVTIYNREVMDYVIQAFREVV